MSGCPISAAAVAWRMPLVNRRRRMLCFENRSGRFMSRRSRKMLRRLRFPSLRRPLGTYQIALYLLIFTVVLLFAVPHVLPWLVQRMVAVLHALLAGLLVVSALREFGGRYNVWRLRRFGRLQWSWIAGLLVFCAMLAWWLSSYAPIQPE